MAATETMWFGNDKSVHDSIINLSQNILTNKLEQDRIRHKNQKPSYGYEYIIILPIRMIDKIHVKVRLNLYENDSKTITLTIHSPKIYLPESGEVNEDGPENLIELLYNDEEILEDEDPKYTIEFIQESLKKVYKYLENIKFDKYTGKFICKTDGNLPFNDWKSYLNIKNVEVDFNECCVCLEPTSTKTMCVHSLCYACWTNLKIRPSEKYDEEVMCCPYCREEISF
jgi:hypothetical protein